jgi:hypothetical protein
MFPDPKEVAGQSLSLAKYPIDRRYLKLNLAMN